MMLTPEQLFQRLKVAEAMRAFISQHSGGVDELRAQLEKVEAELASVAESDVRWDGAVVPGGEGERGYSG